MTEKRTSSLIQYSIALPDLLLRLLPRTTNALGFSSLPSVGYCVCSLLEMGKLDPTVASLSGSRLIRSSHFTTRRFVFMEITAGVIKQFSRLLLLLLNSLLVRPSVPSIVLFEKLILVHTSFCRK